MEYHMQFKKNSFLGWLLGSAEEKPLDDMTKDELETKGREVGIELDKRRKKEALVKQLKKQMKIQK
tara:strand:- start:1193 stop:1390 length:198 start_codon:yes stop_codon:yes gene_type:complete